MRGAGLFSCVQLSMVDMETSAAEEINFQWWSFAISSRLLSLSVFKKLCVIKITVLEPDVSGIGENDEQ